MFRLNKLLTLLFSILLAFSLIGCNSSSDSSQSETKDGMAKTEQNEKSQSEIKTKTKVNQEPNSKMISNEQNKKSNDEVSEKDALESSNKNEVSPSVKTENTLNKKKVEKKEQSTSVPKEKHSAKSDSTTSKTTSVVKKQSPSTATVTVTIIGPKDVGVILEKTKVDFREGDTVLKVLLKATEMKKIQVDYSGSGAMAYVEGIDNVYEFDYGPKSGWSAKQNGITLSKSSDFVKVNKDDRIEWMYTEDYTEE